jgi:hypothetical protein
MTKYRTVIVEVPEMDQLPIDPAAREQLDVLCRAVRTIQPQIKALENTKDTLMNDLKPLAESLGLPERVLGREWDLRKTTRTTDKLNEDRLKVRLLELGMGLGAVNALVAECTDRTVSASWSVYGRNPDKEDVAGTNAETLLAQAIRKGLGIDN